MYPGHTCPRYWDPSGFLRKTSLIDKGARGKVIARLYVAEGSRTAQFPWCKGRTGVHAHVNHGDVWKHRASFTYHIGIIHQNRDGGVDDGNVVLLAGRLQKVRRSATLPVSKRVVRAMGNYARRGRGRGLSPARPRRPELRRRGS